MKAICIDAKGTESDPVKLIEGKSYEVTQCKHFHESFHVYGITPYKEPVTNALVVSLYKSRFVPLSEIDEMELVNELQTVNS